MLKPYRRGFAYFRLLGFARAGASNIIYCPLCALVSRAKRGHLLANTRSINTFQRLIVITITTAHNYKDRQSTTPLSATLLIPLPAGVTNKIKKQTEDLRRSEEQKERFNSGKRKRHDVDVVF